LSFFYALFYRLRISCLAELRSWSPFFFYWFSKSYILFLRASWIASWSRATGYSFVFSATGYSIVFSSTFWPSSFYFFLFLFFFFFFDSSSFYSCFGYSSTCSSFVWGASIPSSDNILSRSSNSFFFYSFFDKGLDFSYFSSTTGFVYKSFVCYSVKTGFYSFFSCCYYSCSSLFSSSSIS